MRKVVVKFIGRRKYSRIDTLTEYKTVLITPNLVNSFTSLYPLQHINTQCYFKSQIKCGYYFMVSITVDNIPNIIDILRTWHRIKLQLCISWRSLIYIENRVNITCCSTWDNIKILENLEIEIQDADYRP